MMVLAAPVFAITVTGVVIENITANCTQSGASKFLRDGQVFILHGGKIHNAFGAEIR